MSKRSVPLAYQPPANKPATNNQSTILFSQNKSAPVISHQPNEQAESWKKINGDKYFDVEGVELLVQKCIIKSDGKMRDFN
jgi:hypothetical protein